jgi:hypothetical protein
MEILSLDEISSWQSFEDLVADYFRAVKQDGDFNVDDVLVQQTGSGADGGRDILVTLTVNDSIMSHKRTWVVQCKFYSNDINKSDLADVNIPSLLHQYGAHGYLLICKNHCTSPVSDMFEGFNDKCRFQRSYVVWSGNNLLKRIRLKSDLIEHYFPKHAEYLKKKEIGAEEILKENQ